MSPYILFFDGHCNLCNNIVNFVIRQDKRRQIQFCPIQHIHLHSQFRPLLSNIKSDSVLLLDRNKSIIFQKSEAIFKIASILGGIWTCLLIGRILPKKLNDLLYDIVAKNRMKIFGKRQKCRIPNSKEKDRFVETT